MTVGEAKSLAREYAVQRAKQLPDFAGAFVIGSTCLRKDEDPFPYTSDVDVLFAVTGPGHDGLTEVEGEYRMQGIEYKGLDIETEYPSIDACRDHDAALGSPAWAPAFRSDNILLDPTGILTALQHAVSTSYAEERWVRARCASLQGWALTGLDKATHRGTPLPGFAGELLERLGWFYLVALTACAGIPCVADLGVYTSRKSFTNCRGVLEAHGMHDLYAKLLGILGASRITRQQAAEAVEEMGRAFDVAVEHARTKSWSLLFFQKYQRRKIIDGAREFLSDHFHREGMFFVAYMRLLAQAVIENDAPPSAREEMQMGHRRLLSMLGIDSESDLMPKVDELRKLLPELMSAAETIIAGSPAVERP
jgi:hypothetical protein